LAKGADFYKFSKLFFQRSLAREESVAFLHKTLHKILHKILLKNKEKWIFLWCFAHKFVPLQPLFASCDGGLSKKELNFRVTQTKL